MDNNYNLFINDLNQCEFEVSKQLKIISEHELVITDRLHGMIFSVITKTSCIAIKNNNYKISSSYEWFKNLEYIKMIRDNDLNEFIKLIQYFKNKNTQNVYDKKIFQYYYNKIRISLKNLII